MGGGLSKFLPKNKGGSRSDGQDLTKVWRNRQKHRRAALFTNGTQLRYADLSQVDFLLALLSPNHMTFAEEDSDKLSLSEMTEKALTILQRNPEGFILFVEGGLIDKGHHQVTQSE